MAEFKFFNIGKANAEIVRLHGELTAAQSKLAQFEQEASSNASEVNAEAERLAAANATLQASITDLTAKLAAAESTVAAAKAAQAAAEASVETKASARALEIVASQGAKPAAAKPSDNPANPKADISHLHGRARVAAAINQALPAKK